MNIYENKIAVVTGATGGIGSELSLFLATNGAKVYGVSRTASKLDSLREKVQEVGGTFVSRPGDITQEGEVEGIIDGIFRGESRLDLLFHCAGEFVAFKLGDGYETLDKIRSVHADAPERITEYIVERFARMGKDIKIVTFLSQAAYKTMHGGRGYGAAKAHLHSYLMHLDLELQGRSIENVQLFGVYPGTVETEEVKTLVARGVLQDPIPLQFIIDGTNSLLMGRGKSRFLGIERRGNFVKNVYFTSREGNLIEVIDENTVGSVSNRS